MAVVLPRIRSLKLPPSLLPSQRCPKVVSVERDSGRTSCYLPLRINLKNNLPSLLLKIPDNVHLHSICCEFPRMLRCFQAIPRGIQGKPSLLIASHRISSNVVSHHMNRLLAIIHRSVALMPHGVFPELVIDPLAMSIEVGIAGYSSRMWN